MNTSPAAAAVESPGRKPLYTSLWAQVLVAIVLAIALGHFFPSRGIAMKPLGDGFIKLITMIITLVIFCTVVSGIAGMQDIKKVGRVGGKALIYFEIVSTLALLLGMIVGNVLRPGDGLNVNASTLDAKAVMDYAGQAKAQNAPDFLMHIIPTTVVDAFAKGDILQVLFVSILSGLALSVVGARGQFLVDLIEALTRTVFAIVNIIMRFAPIGAFGAMAFTVGKYGLVSLGPLAKLIGSFYLSCVLFVVIVLGAISLVAGFNIIKFLLYIKEEILLVLATSSSETALPALMEKLEGLGCSKALVGTGSADRFHVQYRWKQPLHDTRCFIRCASNRHQLDLGTASHDLCGCNSYIQRSERGSGSRIHCSGRNLDCDADHSCGRNGTPPMPATKRPAATPAGSRARRTPT